MRRSQKSKRVTWATDINLCQVRLFLSEDSPSQVGTGTQDHLQAKALGPEQSGAGSDDNLPPGFEGIQPSNMWRVNLSQIPLIKWRTPPRFKANIDWRVVAGEESSEIKAQNERELGVLEAIYPRPSAIPRNPTSSVDNPVYNDENTQVIPVTPIEDEDALPDGSTSANNSELISQPSGTLSSVGNVTPEVVAAAQAAVSAVMSSSDSGNLIDRELLLRILSDPKMIEQLISSHAASPTTQNTPSSSVHGMPISTQHMNSVPSNMHTAPSSSSQTRPAILMPNPPQNNLPSTSTQYSPHMSSNPKSSFDMVNAPRPELAKPSYLSTAPPFYPPGTARPPVTNVRPSVPDAISSPSPTLGGPMKKDINYYKSLIQQHGTGKRENAPQFGTGQEQMSKNLMQQHHGNERPDMLPPYTHQSNQPSRNSQESMHMNQHRDSKPKIMKPCIYFNTSRGCRNGASCSFQHDTSSQQRVSGNPDVQSSKRMKLDREITGT